VANKILYYTGIDKNLTVVAYEQMTQKEKLLDIPICSDLISCFDLSASLLRELNPIKSCAILSIPGEWLLLL